jgi:beta-galactosidase
MHAGLERPDGAPAPAYEEARAAARDAACFDGLKTAPADVAIVFSYEARWLYEIQPQGAAWSYPELVFEWYAALRRRGVDIDIIDAGADLGRYRLVLAPSLPTLSEEFVAACAAAPGLFLFGPRTGSKTRDFQIPAGLAPGPLKRLIPLTIAASETFPAAHREIGKMNEIAGRVWLDCVETDLKPLAETSDGKGLLYRSGRVLYLATVPDAAFLDALVIRLLEEAGVATATPPEGVRLRRIGDLQCAFNYAPEPVELDETIAPAGASFVLGDRRLAPAGVSIWRARR